MRIVKHSVYLLKSKEKAIRKKLQTESRLIASGLKFSRPMNAITFNFLIEKPHKRMLI